MKRQSKTRTEFRPVVIGASFGGVEALMALVRKLPSDLNAPVLIVLHTASEGPGLLPQILHKSGVLPAAHARNRQPLKPGHIYIAPPDHHLVLNDGQMQLNRGPKINRSRPAIDQLFESAAENYGPRAIGVLLTGALADGVAGLERIKQEGGVAIVQHPHEAICPEMPLNALRRVAVDFVLPLSEIAVLINKLVNEPVTAPTGQLALKPQQKEADVKAKPQKIAALLTCPECHGPIHEEKNGAVTRYVCRVGHAFSTESFLAAHNESLERSLWAAVQMLEERAELLRRVAERLSADGQMGMSNLHRKAQDCEKHAATIRKVFEKLPST